MSDFAVLDATAPRERDGGAARALPLAAGPVMTLGGWLDLFNDPPPSDDLTEAEGEPDILATDVDSLPWSEMSAGDDVDADSEAWIELDSLDQPVETQLPTLAYDVDDQLFSDTAADSAPPAFTREAEPQPAPAPAQPASQAPSGPTAAALPAEADARFERLSEALLRRMERLEISVADTDRRTAAAAREAEDRIGRASAAADRALGAATNLGRGLLGTAQTLDRRLTSLERGFDEAIRARAEARAPIAPPETAQVEAGLRRSDTPPPSVALDALDLVEEQRLVMARPTLPAADASLFEEPAFEREGPDLETAQAAVAPPGPTPPWRFSLGLTQLKARRAGRSLRSAVVATGAVAVAAVSYTPHAEALSPDPQPSVSEAVRAKTAASPIAAPERASAELRLVQLWRAAEAGAVDAQLSLATLFETGEGAPRDLAAARHWTARAAEAGDPRAMHNFAHYFVEGEGGPKSLPSALFWFRAAAERGLIDSAHNVAQLERALLANG